MLRWNKVTCMLSISCDSDCLFRVEWFIFPTQPCPNVFPRCWSKCVGLESWTPCFLETSTAAFAVRWNEVISRLQSVLFYDVWTHGAIYSSDCGFSLRIFAIVLCFYSSASQCSALPIKCEPDKEREREAERGAGVGCTSQWGSAIVGAVCSFTSDLCYPSKPEDRGGAAVLLCSLRTHG